MRGIEPDYVLDLLLDLVGLCGRQVDLVENRNNLVIVIDRLIDIGEGLRFDALARVDDQQRAFAGGERAVDLVGEVHVAGRIDQVEDVVLAVARLVVQAHRLGLDGDAALALDIHRIENLLHHFAIGEAAGDLDQPIGKRRLAVVDMRHDGKVADVLDWSGGHGARDSIEGRGRQARCVAANRRAGRGNVRRFSVGRAETHCFSERPR